MEETEFGFTVHDFISRQNEILLVHEIGEENGKPANWGMPGGSVLVNPKQDMNLSEQEVLQTSFDTIRSLVRKLRISEEALAELLRSNPPLELLFFLTSVREALEETGVLVQPICELMRETTEPRFEHQSDSIHQVVVVQGYILEGEPCCNYEEIDDIAWFPLRALPDDLYVSHRRRIQLSVKKLHLDLFEEMTVNVQ